MTETQAREMIAEILHGAVRDLDIYQAKWALHAIVGLIQYGSLTEEDVSHFIESAPDQKLPA